METQTKQSIEETARQLLNYKVKGKGEFPHPFNDAKLCAEAIQYLVDKEYVASTGETPKCLEYHVTLEGFEYVYDVEKAIHTTLLSKRDF
ncbi:unnamed protein product [marine sediment metagenome]|uniref:Uncharacterized protein n=1 Tax=marine sediment metagenome TaxID=412755 RepID=X1PCX1_9ZZZZ